MTLLWITFSCCLNRAFAATSIKIPKNDTVLVATKGDRQFTYKYGSHLLIKFGNPSTKFSGKLFQVSNDSVWLTQKDNADKIQKIAISDIHSITILHKKTRKNWILILSTLFILLSIGLTLSTDANLAALLFLIPSVPALMVYVPLLFLNILSDILSKKSIKKGWAFKSTYSRKID